jgi:hypothetical protein
MEGSRDREEDGEEGGKMEMGMIGEMGDGNEREAWR